VSATGQTNATLVYYVLAAEVEPGDVVTWKYTRVSGHITSRQSLGSVPLEDTGVKPITNNVVSSVPILAEDGSPFVTEDGTTLQTEN
jgi:hypothetical protein